MNPGILLLTFYILGLCGTYDFNQRNDFKTKQGDIETNTNAFGNRWKTAPSCVDVDLNATSKPCEENAQRKNESSHYCSYLTSDIFKGEVLFTNTDIYYILCNEIQENID